MSLKNTVDYFAEEEEEKKDITDEAIEISDAPVVDYFAEEEEKEKPKEEEVSVETKQIDYFAEEDEDKPKTEDSFQLDPTYAEETYEDKVKTLDEFSKDENFLATLRSYGKKRFGESGMQMEGESNKDYVKRFVTHYRQINANTLDLMGQVDWIRSSSEQDKAEFGAIYRDIQRLPSFYEEGGTGTLDGLLDYAKAVITDPVSLIGLGTAKIATTAATQLAKKAILETGKRKALSQSSRIGFQAIKKPLIVEAGVEGLRGAYDEYALAQVEKEAEMLDDEGEFKKDASVSDILIAAGLSSTIVGTIGGIGYKSLGKSAINDARKQLIKEGKNDRLAAKAFGGNANPDKSIGRELTMNADDISFDPTEGRRILDSLDPDLDLSNLDILDKKVKVDVIKRVSKVATETVEDLLKDKTGKYDEFLSKYQGGDGKASEAIGEILQRFNTKEFEGIDLDVLDGAIARAGLTQKQFSEITYTSFSEAGQLLQAASPLGKLFKGYKESDPILKKLFDEKFGNMGDTETSKLASFMQRLDRERRALMVTQLSTTVRNVATGVTRLGFESAYNLMESSLYHAGRAINSLATGKAVEDITSGNFQRGLRDIGRDAFGLIAFTLDNNTSKDLANAMLKYNPQLLRTLNRTTGEVTGTESLSRFTMALNHLNIMQDGFFRRGVFTASIDKKLRRMGTNLADVHRQGTVLPTKLVGDAVEDALSFTFSRMPKQNSKKYVGDGIAYNFIKFNEALGPLPGLVGVPAGTGAFPFARFMTNAMQFQFQYSPVSFVGATLNSVGGLGKYLKGDFKAGERQFNKAREQLAKGMVGYAALQAAIYHRSNNQDVKWYESKTEDGRTADMRPFFPLAPYLIVADFIVKWDNNELDKIDTKDLLEGITGAQFRTGSSSYMIESFYKNLRSPTGLTDITGEKLAEYMGGYLGELVGGAITPGRIVRDVVAAFDKEEAVIRDFNQIDGSGASERGMSAFSNSIMRNLPFVKEYYPELESATREGKIYRQSPLGTQLTGVRKEMQRTPVEKELVKFGLETYNVVPSTGDKSADAFVKRYMGKYVDKEVKKIVESEKYQNLSDVKKKAMLLNYLKLYRNISKEIGKAEAQNEAKLEGKAFTAFDRAQWSRLGSDRRKLADEYYMEKYGMTVMEMQEAEPDRNHLLVGKIMGNVLSATTM